MEWTIMLFTGMRRAGRAAEGRKRRVLLWLCEV